MSLFWYFSIKSYNFGISLSLLTVSERFCGKLLETFVILSAFLFPIKSPVDLSVKTAAAALSASATDVLF